MDGREKGAIAALIILIGAILVCACFPFLLSQVRKHEEIIPWGAHGIALFIVLFFALFSCCVTCVPHFIKRFNNRGKIAPSNSSADLVGAHHHNHQQQHHQHVAMVKKETQGRDLY
ncbi:hypothetical protein PIB30_017968 [Stylosanthes scabra]|uniref:Uncharacterized protein n=1 Tax=Stylosanthes scabra TaxID=79078 RepID=A0ABU6T7J4_9FABA|nr:hypothetical protein [Stylosanthes scabra]